MANPAPIATAAQQRQKAALISIVKTNQSMRHTGEGRYLQVRAPMVGSVGPGLRRDDVQRLRVSYKSIQCGLSRSIKLNFHSRFHSFSCFSRRIALSAVG